jgi:hypothetical protein
VSKLLAAVLLIVALALLTVGLLGWQQRLPRNRFAGIRTAATLRSDAAFSAANRVAAVALGAGGAALSVFGGVAGAGAVGLLLAGGLLGHRVASAVPPPTGGCAGCICSGGGCSAT